MLKEIRRFEGGLTVPLVFITRLFQLVSERKFAEAERTLERITARMEKSDEKEFNKGYLRALDGIILTSRSGSETDEFFGNLDLNDVGALKRYHKDFLQNAKSRFHADYDRGYFSALADYMRVVLKTARSSPKAESG
jgi:ATP/maltotriose-dependent transcriptional regulator MalT